MTENTKDTVTIVGDNNEPPRLGDKLNQLAMDVVQGNVFGDFSIPLDQRAQMIPQIFLPIALAGRDCLPPQEFYGGVYQYVSKAGPRSVDGYPIFNSFICLHALDRAPLLATISHYAQSVKALVGAPEAANDG